MVSTIVDNHGSIFHLNQAAFADCIIVPDSWNREFNMPLFRLIPMDMHHKVVYQSWFSRSVEERCLSGFEGHLAIPVGTFVDEDEADNQCKLIGLMVVGSKLGRVLIYVWLIGLLYMGFLPWEIGFHYMGIMCSVRYG